MLRNWEERRLLASVADLAGKSKAQLRQDLWVLAETGRKRGGFFVEIGAFDGIHLSNTYLLEKEFGWTGILVEPNPERHAALRENRNASISTSAIYSKKGTVDFLNVQNDPEMSGIATHVYDDRNADRRQQTAQVIQVDTITPGELFRQYAVPACIDYLSVDTEGSEFEILSAIDFTKYDVRLISVEHNRLAEREMKTERFLAGVGFRRVYRRASRFDAWYKRNTFT